MKTLRYDTAIEGVTYIKIQLKFQKQPCKVVGKQIFMRLENIFHAYLLDVYKILKNILYQIHF